MQRFNLNGPRETGFECPACSGRRHVHVGVNGRTFPSLYSCERCGCVHGSGYKGDVLSVVLVGTLRGESASGESLPFNVEMVGSDGVTRSHGWFDPVDGVVHQYG